MDSDEESSIKVSGIERFYGSGGVCVGVCVVVVLVFTSLETLPTSLKLGTTYKALLLF